MPGSQNGLMESKTDAGGTTAPSRLIHMQNSHLQEFRDAPLSTAAKIRRHPNPGRPAEGIETGRSDLQFALGKWSKRW